MKAVLGQILRRSTPGHGEAEEDELGRGNCGAVLRRDAKLILASFSPIGQDHGTVDPLCSLPVLSHIDANT